ncbi:MAG: succinylglutamate desuccinylase/aspartoacylase family protein [Myxococcales bacterium]|nr:succinylglutamate desuccinylase/aspartoacylase family protein [Myxococcales bacterium]
MPLPAGVTFLTPTVPVHVFDADVAGPTVLIEAGIHGDEIAGVHAVQELLEEELRPERGRLILIPPMNPPAYRARQRARPGGLDLNRCFPGDAEAAEPENRLAAKLMALMLDEQPALVATLHESQKRHHPDIPASFGQSIVYGVQPMPEVVLSICEILNQELEHPYERWAPHYYPVATSSTEVIVEAVGCVGLCIETWMGFEERRRVDMQRRVVMLLLAHFGVVHAA